MQKLYTRSRNPILLLLLASALLFTSFTAMRGLLNPGWRNERYFAKAAKELMRKIEPGMSQAEVDAILDEYDFIAIFETEGRRIVEIYGEDTEISSYYELFLGGDPKNSGVITNCKMLIVFYKDPLIERKVRTVSDMGEGYCGRLGYFSY